MLREFAIKAMAVPFQEKGRTTEGWDCWGLVVCAYKDVLGVDLPSYADRYIDTGDSEETRKELNDLINGNKEKWATVTGRCKPMDVALFTLGGLPIHVAVMIDHKNFLHVSRRIGTCIESIESVSWTRRFEGAYRLCQA